MPVLDRFNFAKMKQLCINCLNEGHRVFKCASSKCRVCSHAHHTPLHRYQNLSEPHQGRSWQDQQGQGTNTSHASTHSAQVLQDTSEINQVILAAGVVNVRDRFGQLHRARALSDSGSQVNFMTESLAQLLRLSRTNKCLTITSVGESNSIARSKVTTTLYSRLNGHIFTSEFWVLGTITSNHNRQFRPA